MCIGSFSLHSKWIGLSKRYPNSSVLRRDVESDRLIGNRCYIKLSLVNILENVFVFIEILFKMLLFKGGVLIYAEHCICIYIYMCVLKQCLKLCA